MVATEQIDALEQGLLLLMRSALGGALADCRLADLPSGSWLSLSI